MSSALGSFLGYTVLLLLIGLWSYRLVEKVPIGRYEEEFYAAGRGLGGAVVALVIASGMASAGTFIAGPGMCYAYGYSWVLINVMQSFLGLMLLGAVGIMVGLVARRVKLVTYLDLYEARYRDRTLVLVMGGLVTLLLIPYMATQFVGAARVIVQMTGVGYPTALALGSAVVALYCVLGGMRAAALATLVQGAVITLGTVLLFAGTLRAAGGFAGSTAAIETLDARLLSPTADGAFPWSFVFSVACLSGYLAAGSPHGMLAALSYRNTAALKRGIWLGAILVFVWTLLLCLAGVVGRALVPDLAVADEIAPWLAMNVLPGPLAGIVLAGVVAGIQTTVAAMAIVITSSVARNMVRALGLELTPRQLKTLSRATMTACLAASIALALTQPPLVQWIILFALGGIAVSAFAPIVVGLYWKRGNRWGALAAVGCGMSLYVAAFTIAPGIGLWGMHPSLPCTAAAVAAYVLVSLATPAPPESVQRTFWGRLSPAGSLLRPGEGSSARTA
jgi:sodium/pantothenate symporter